jgi:hypothetical protein
MLAGHGMPAEGFLRHRGLIALAIVGAVAEASLLTVFAPAARPIAPQITALPPLAIFHDLRWLFGYNRSWYGFELAYAGLVFAQAAISTVMMRLAWPHELARPTWPATFGRCVIFTVIASVLLSPVVTLLFGVSLLPFSWPFLAALPALLLILLPLAHAGLRGSWWRTLPPARAIGWLLASFIVLSGAAAAMANVPAAAAIAVAGLAGLVNARAWYGLAAAVNREWAPSGAPWARAWRRHPRSNARGRAEPARPGPAERRPWPAPLSPLAAATGLALIVGMTRLLFVVAGTTPLPGGPASVPTRAAALAAAAPAGHADPKLTDAVLVIPGFGSSCCYPSRSRELIGPSALVRPFSYAGLDAQGRPLPYGLDATDLPLPLLGDRIAQQVAQLHKETGRPVDIVAESEGTLGVYAMLARHPGLPLGSIVLLSPIVDPGQADPALPPGQLGNPVSGAALSELVRAAGAISPFGSSGAGDLIQSVRADGAAFAAAAAKNGQRIHWLAVVPLADAVTLPVCDLPGNVIVVNALHGSLLGDDAIDRLAHRFLSDQPVGGQQQLRDTAQVIAAAASAWRMPAIGTASPACSG